MSNLKALSLSSSYCSSSSDSPESNLRRPGELRIFQKRVAINQAGILDLGNSAGGLDQQVPVPRIAL